MGVVANLTIPALPAATVVTDLYIVPQRRRANAKLWVANQSAADSWRLAVSPLGVALDPSHYMIFDEPLSASGTVACSDERQGIHLQALDVLRVRSTNGTTSFVLSVYEEDA